MAGRGSEAVHTDNKQIVHMMGVGVALCSLLLVTCAESPSASPSATRQRRSDDYDNMDNFLMGSGDYDNFFLKTAKSVPRIGRRSGGSEDQDQTPLHVDRRSTDANELVPSYAHGYDHFFLKASKSVPRIGKRNDEFFMKSAKTVPRIGRRSGDGPDNFLHKGRDPSDYLKSVGSRPRRAELLEAMRSRQGHHRMERRSHLQVDESEWPMHSSVGGNDAVLSRQHRIQRRNYDEIMAKAAKTVPRMGKRMHPALDEVGDWGTEQQWPWFRQQDTSPGPYKRTNPADLIDLSDVPWESLDLLLRRLEQGRRGAESAGPTAEEDDKAHGVVLLDADLGEAADVAADNKWTYSVLSDKKHEAARPRATGSTATGNKELEEVRFQPDVRRKRK